LYFIHLCSIAASCVASAGFRFFRIKFCLGINWSGRSSSSALISDLPAQPRARHSSLLQIVAAIVAAKVFGNVGSVPARAASGTILLAAGLASLALIPAPEWWWTVPGQIAIGACEALVTGPDPAA
jgi:hypothetical protein